MLNDKFDEVEAPYIYTDEGWQRILLERDISWIVEKVKEALENAT